MISDEISVSIASDEVVRVKEFTAELSSREVYISKPVKVLLVIDVLLFAVVGGLWHSYHDCFTVWMNTKDIHHFLPYLFVGALISFSVINALPIYILRSRAPKP